MNNNDPKVTPELCEVRTELINSAIKNLETRFYETMKKYTQVSDMTHIGHKDALGAAIRSLQKDLDFGSDRFSNLDKTINELNSEVKGFVDDINTTMKEFKKDIKSIDKTISNLDTDLKLVNQSVKVCDNKTKQSSKIIIAILVAFVLFLVNKGDVLSTYETLVKLVKLAF